MLVNLNKILPQARQQRYAVPHFNFSDLEVAQGIMAAAVELKSPVIFGTSESAIEYAGIDNLVDIVKNLAEQHPEIPVALHLDHGKSFEICRQAIEAGYTSVMIDGSFLQFQSNIDLTRKVVNYACKHNASVEGELGIVGKLKIKNKKSKTQSKNQKYIEFPTGLEAKEFVEKTKVDALAVGLGTAHGLSIPDERIHFNVLEEVAGRVSIPLVLHGGSNLPVDQIKKAVTIGISKVNTDTELRQAFTRQVRRDLKKKDLLDPREYLGDAREAVKKAALAKIEQLESTNKI